MSAEPEHAETADTEIADIEIAEPGTGDGAPAFRTDLYRGTAPHYDRYRPPYPPELLADLLERAGVSGRGRLLDLACGTGHLAFPLRHRFTEVWAVDQEPDMVEQVRAKAAAAHAAGIRPVRSSAQDLNAEPGGFELVTVGNAFHRLDRDLVARRVLDWLAPGGGFALCWSGSPWAGERDWQRALAALLGDWRTRLGAEDRVPEGWDAQRRRRPDRQVLSETGFADLVRREFPVEHRWTLEALGGNLRSTSFLSPAVLGGHGAAFDAELAAALAPHAAPDGTYLETDVCSFELARKP